MLSYGHVFTLEIYPVEGSNHNKYYSSKKNHLPDRIFYYFCVCIISIVAVRNRRPHGSDEQQQIIVHSLRKTIDFFPRPVHARLQKHRPPLPSPPTHIMYVLFVKTKDNYILAIGHGYLDCYFPILIHLKFFTSTPKRRNTSDTLGFPSSTMCACSVKHAPS